MEYQVKWKGWNHDDNTWEPVGNLDCQVCFKDKPSLHHSTIYNHCPIIQELIEEFERTYKADASKKNGEKRKADDKPGKAAKKADTRVKGFSRGLTAEKIIGATNDPGELYFLIKVW